MIIEALEDVTVKEAKDAILQCKIRSPTEPNIKWYVFKLTANSNQIGFFYSSLL